ncbi:MAG: TIGR00296 family protein, partial [Nitrososphaerales archaeon]
KFYQKMGVFVTLNTASPTGRELRGCIGHPLPERPLVDALIDAAICSAARDPRFPRISPEELEDLVVEVSILTPPERISVSSPKEYCNHIQVGEDGLIVRWRFGSGLLLPQVPVEYGWGPEDFLCHTCMKAGATPDHWLTPDAEIYKFKAIVFDETTPRGRVVRRRLK